MGVLVWGFLADLISTRVDAGRYYLVALNFIGCAPFAFMILHVDSLGSMKLACVGFGLFAGGLSSNIVAAAYDVIAERNYGLTSGLINLAGGIGGGTGVLLVGWFNNPDSALNVVKWGAIGVVAAAIAVTAIARRRYASEHNHAVSLAEQ